MCSFQTTTVGEVSHIISSLENKTTPNYMTIIFYLDGYMNFSPNVWHKVNFPHCIFKRFLKLHLSLE